MEEKTDNCQKEEKQSIPQVITGSLVLMSYTSIDSNGVCLLVATC